MLHCLNISVLFAHLCLGGLWQDTVLEAGRAVGHRWVNRHSLHIR